EQFLLDSGPQIHGTKYMYGWLTNLHNGPLEVLVYFGIPGAVVFTCLMFRTLCLVIKSANEDYKQQEGVRFCGIFEALTFTTICLFLLTVGNSHGTVLNMSLNLTMIYIIKKAYLEPVPDKGSQI